MWKTCGKLLWKIESVENLLKISVLNNNDFDSGKRLSYENRFSQQKGDNLFTGLWGENFEVKNPLLSLSLSSECGKLDW